MHTKQFAQHFKMHVFEAFEVRLSGCYCCIETDLPSSLSDNLK